MKKRMKFSLWDKLNKWANNQADLYLVVGDEQVSIGSSKKFLKAFEKAKKNKRIHVMPETSQVEKEYKLWDPNAVKGIMDPVEEDEKWKDLAFSLIGFVAWLCGYRHYADHHYMHGKGNWFGNGGLKLQM